MLKKTLLFLMINILCLQQSFTGSGRSTLLDQEQDPQSAKKRVLPQKTISVQKPAFFDSSDDDIKIGMKMAELTIEENVCYCSCKTSQAPKSFSQRSQEHPLESISQEDPSPNSRRDNSFFYSSENFDQDAWKREKGLPNRFPNSTSQKKYGRLLYSENSHLKGKWKNSSSSDSEIEDNPESLEITSSFYKGCPVIDLSCYEAPIREAAPMVDLHPLHNKNFKKHLRDEIFQRQLAYHHCETRDRKIYINTGTGKKRPDPNFTLQNTVGQLLDEDYFYRRIAYFRLEQEGLFAIFLRKNIKPTEISAKNKETKFR